jgi:hypothetical protein
MQNVHKYSVFTQKEPFTLKTYSGKVNKNRVFARSIFTFW